MAELNLVPFKVKQKKAKELKNKQLAIVIIVVVAIMAVIYGVPKLTLIQLKRNESALTNAIISKSSVKTTNAKYRTQVENYTNYINKCDLVKKEKVIAETKITGIQSYMPKDVVCTNVSYNMKTITLTGTATNYNSVCEFVANIQMAHLYTSARINSISVSNDGKTNTYNFNILVTY